MSDTQGLPQLLHYLKDAHGVSLRALSKELGITPGHLSRVAARERQLSVSLADDIARAVNRRTPVERWLPVIFCTVTLFDRSLSADDARAAADAICARRVTQFRQ